MKFVSDEFGNISEIVPEGGTISVRKANFSDAFLASEKFRIKILDGRKSIIGHQDLANIIGVECNRESIALNPGDCLLVCQVIGGRLPVGCRKLPEGISLEWFYVQVEVPRKEWDSEYGKNSIYGSIRQAAEKIAALPVFSDCECAVTDEADAHNNFFSVVRGTGIYAELWDD